MITAEIEKINYSRASLSSQTDGLDFTQDNKEIKSTYANVLNIRLGGEYRFGNFRARLGYSYMPDPNNAVQSGVDNSIMGYSAGAGYRTDKYFVDLGFIQTQWNSVYYPYKVFYHGQSPFVTQKNSNVSVMVTVGFNL